jgi:hypothetical protein
MYVPTSYCIRASRATPLLTDACLVAQGESGEVVMYVCYTCCLKDLAIAAVWTPITYVVQDCIVEQHSVLRHHSDCSPYTALRGVSNILTVYQDPTGLRVIEAQEQPAK